MVAVNCAGLPETLLESELFGHVKGSFTGAYRDKQGKLEMADGGSIFLDEIGEMTLRMQGLLLRFMETGELQKVGADRIAGRVNVRVIAATNRNLRDMISEGTFREDLFYRLNVIHLVVPPLRERREDIPALIDYFMTGSRATTATRCKFISPDANKLLVRLLVARQRARARERDRAPGRDRPHRIGDAGEPADGDPDRSRRLGCGRSANAAEPSPTISTRSWSRSGNRSGRSSIRSTCSARSRAATCATWCARGSRTRAAITRSSRSCSTWNRATTSGF